MKNHDEKSDNPAPPLDGPEAADLGETVYQGILAWLRQLTLRDIIARPWLIIYEPRLWLEKPWLPVALLGSVGLVKGIISGAQQGESEGIGKMAEGALVGGVMGLVICALIMAPFSLGLWVAREVGRRFAARRRTSAISDSRLASPAGGDELRQFPCRPNRFLVVVLCLLCACGESLFCYFAIEDHYVFGYIMAIAGSFGLIVSFGLVIIAFTGEWRVAFADDEIIVPKPHWWRMVFDEIRIAFHDIISLQFTNDGLTLIHRQGKYFPYKFMFPSRSDCDSVTALLVESLAESERKEARATNAESVSGEPSD
jgi:hypothetical protein